MEVYTNYNYQQIQIPNNYPIYENSINELQSKYINQSNNYINNYSQYEIKPYIYTPAEINISSNIYNIQSNEIIDKNNPFENYYINNHRNTMIKIPEDKNIYLDKMPKDNLKGKHNSLKQKNNFNKINRIKILLNEYELREKNENKENKENKEKQPKDNYKKYTNENELTKNKRKNKNLNIKININDNNTKEINNNNNYNNTSYQKNYLRTNENHLQASKRNSIKTIERINKKNLISINDVLSNNKKNVRSSYLKDIKSNAINSIYKKTLNKSKQKSTNSLRSKINKLKKNENKELDKNYSTNKIKSIKEKEKSDSNFASLINQKKLKMFSSYRQINNTGINNEENIPSGIKPKRMTISKNTLAKKNRTINLNSNLGRLYSPQITSSNKLGNETQTEIKKTKVIIKKRNTNTNINKQLKRNISYNYDISSSNTKKKFNSNTYLTERKIGNIRNRNVFKNKKTFSTNKNEGGTVIRHQLSLRNTKVNTEENNNNNLYNRNTMRFSRKKIIYSRDKNSKEKKEVIINQKINLFSFMKKTHKKESFHSHDKLSEEKIDMHNKSYKGFSSIKKLEEIKKKYKFFPHTKGKRNIIKDKNIDYIEESNIFSKLINSMDLNKSNEVRNLNLTEFLPKQIKKQNEANNEIKILENEEEEKNEENENDDMLNRKSFILDLNNVIPINEKKLKDTMSKQHLIDNNINMDLK